jgi:Zn-dependent peptidase ImmA (M78 family)/transcriptional regulator with XRE-family HTH domain
MTRSIDNFVPERLQQALDARGFSATELAARVGVTTTTMSRWRNRAQVPAAPMLDALARELRVSPEWLTRPMAPALSPPCFRGSVAQMKHDRAILSARVEWLSEVAAQFASHVDFPAVNIPTFPATTLSAITQADIEEMADECRKRWSLAEGPIGNMVLLLENAGVIVAREETGTPRIEGLSSWSPDGRPFVFLCADKGNAFRSRFDAAHELGHLVLHSRIEVPLDAAAHKLMEQQAHRFAGAFLMPARSFSAEVSSPPTLQGLLFLKQRWGVSVAAMIMRLVALRLVDDNDYLRLIKQRSAKWGARQEPGDDLRTPEEPRLLKRTAHLLANEGLVSMDALPMLLGISARDVEGLLGLAFGELTARPAEIVDLALRRKESGPALSGTISDTSVTVLPFDRNKRK